MKLYKKARPTTVYTEGYKAERYAYLCPFCSTQHLDYSLSTDVVRIKCSHCYNEIILNWK